MSSVHSGSIDKIINGKLPSRFILIEDSLVCPGKELLKYFFRTKAEKIALIFLENHINEDYKVEVHDLFNYHYDKSFSDFITQLTSNSVSLVIVDSLSPALICDSLSNVLISLNKLIQKGTSIVSVIHTDVHSEFELKCLKQLASTHIQLAKDSRLNCFKAECVHLKPNRRVNNVIRWHEFYQINNNGIEFIEIPKTNEIPVKISTADPTANLPFNLKLTEDEAEAKKNLVLPYVK